MQTDKKELDQFEKKLEEQIIALHECQQKHQVDSCLKCPHIIGCEMRKTYVIAVYNSMSKGDTGGFEF